MRYLSRLVILISAMAGSIFVMGPAIAQEDKHKEMNGQVMNSTESSSSPSERSVDSASQPAVKKKARHDAMAMPEGVFDRNLALKISKKAMGRKLEDYAFTDMNGNAVRFSDYQGKPLLVNFIYTSCMHTCPLIVESLERSTKVARKALGKDSFTILTVGFDWANDSPNRMKSYSGDRRIGDDNWHLLSADKDTIESITKALGFFYREAPYGFDHLAQVSVVDEEGVVYRQIYGVELNAPVVVEPLKQLVFGRKSNYTSFSGLTNQVKLFCTIYDPNTGHYKFDFSFIISLVIGLTILSIFVVLFVRAWLNLKKRENSA